MKKQRSVEAKKQRGVLVKKQRSVVVKKQHTVEAVEAKGDEVSKRRRMKQR